MDGAFVTENTAKSRSFRREDYNNRRVFLRSYPLHWGSEDERSEEVVRMIEKNAKKKPSKKSTRAENERTEDKSFRSYRKNDQKKPIKNIVLSVYHWGEGKVIILKRFKNKVAVHVVACIQARKQPTGLISA